VVVAAVAAWAALSETVVDVEIATVARGALSVSVSEEGQTRVRDRYVVATPVDGRVTRALFDEGDTVLAGAVIARIYPRPEDPRVVGMARGRLAAAEARRPEAQARVESARAGLAQAQRELERARVLTENGALSQETMEQAEFAEVAAREAQEIAQAALSSTAAEIETAQAALLGIDADSEDGGVEVRVPSSGRVLRVLEESARVVPAGTVLIEIGDARQMEVVVDVLSEDAVRIETGQPVLIERWGGPAILHGRVRLLEPEAFTRVSALGVEVQRVNVVIDLADAPPSLGAG
jgi:HlyD family secretion protein